MLDCVDPQLNNSLQELYFAFNELTDEFTADDNFIHLGKLRKLSLWNNNLVSFPLDDRVLRAFENTLIDLSDNGSLRSPPRSVIESGESLKAYLDDLRAESSPAVHIQVMVVGNGGVGKTTWCRTALLGKKPFFYGMVLVLIGLSFDCDDDDDWNGVKTSANGIMSLWWSFCELGTCSVGGELRSL